MIAFSLELCENMFVDCTQTHTCTPVGLHARPGLLHTLYLRASVLSVHRVPKHIYRSQLPSQDLFADL